MRLTLKQQWRPRPLSSFLGFMDLKVGVTIALIFAILNKVAGVYGLVSLFIGASFAQLSLYAYSVLGLVAFAWGLKSVAEENAKKTLYFAHFFFADHVVSTAWTVFFAVVWWVYTPHDGRRRANSAAQEEMMRLGRGHNMTDAERTDAAMMIWNKEKGLASAVIIAGWFVKIYFSILLYSFAIHLRKGSYHSLPLTSSSSNSQYYALPGAGQRSSAYPDTALLGPGADEDDEEYEFQNLYHVPGRTNTTVPYPVGPAYFNNSRVPASSFSTIKGNMPRDDEIEEEVLFDSDELAGGKSKLGTEESTSVSSHDDDGQDMTAAGKSNRDRYKLNEAP